MSRRLAIAFPLVVMVVFTGCTVGPDYRAPGLPAGAAGSLISVKPAVETTAPPPQSWWRLYDDPLLDQLIQQAFAANADLAEAEAHLAAARALLEGARNGQYPQTGVQAAGIYGRNATTDEILEINGHPPKSGWSFDDILDVSYELDLFGRVRRTIEASKADTEAAAAARDSVKITIAAETARAYAQLCTLGEQITVAQHSLEVVSKEADITVHRREAGAGSEFDVVRAQEIAAQTQATIPPLQGQRRAALFELAALLGTTPSQAPVEAERCITAPHLSALIPIGDGAALLARRPDVRLADRRFAAATARVGVATADLYPRISLTGLVGGAAPDLVGLTENRGLTWGLGPTVTWTFPNQAGVWARIHGSQAEANAALASFNSVVLQALRETESSLATYGAELDHRQALADAREKARRAFEIAQREFIAGGASSLDLLTAEQTLVAADAAVAASDAALAQDQIGVFKALGGGWNVGS